MRALSVLRRFRVLIIAAICTVIALTTAFLITQGIIYEEGSLPESFTYGETINYTAKAMFSKVRYEYRAEGSDVWTQDPPARAGKYYVRGVAEGSFKSHRYTDERAFTILPRTVTVYVSQDSVRYGDDPAVAADGLMYRDSVSCTSYTYADTSKVTTQVTPDVSGIVLLNEKGEDVTASYTISTVATDISFTRRPLTVTVASVSMEYNGEALTSEDYEIPEGSLVMGDKESVVFRCSQTEVGMVLNTPEFSILNAQGVDVTHQYEITKVIGTLTVEKRLLIITTEGEVFVYDGTEHHNSNYQIDASTPLLEGDREVLLSSTTIKDVGKKENVLSFDILNAGGESVIDKYYLVQFSNGMLEVKKRTVRVETATNSWVYDDAEHFDSGYTSLGECDGIAQGHTLVIEGAPILQGVSSIENNGVAHLFDAEGNEVTENYDIQYVYGTVSITQRPIEITADSAEKIYDATALTAGIKTHTELAENAGLLAGHSVEIVEQSELTDVGSVENVLLVKILNSNGEDVSANYAISYVKGTLTVTQRPMDITADSDEKIYDGTVLTKPTAAPEAESEGRGLLAAHRVESIIIEGAITLAGSVDNIITEGSVKILDENGNDVTANYAINPIGGKLTVHQRPIDITANSDEKVYDGKPLTNGGYTHEEEGDGRGLLAGHTIKEITVEGTVTNAVSVDNVIKEGSVVIVDADGNDVTESYAINLIKGSLTVTVRPIDITADSNEKVYDGTELTDDGYVAESESTDRGLVEGQQIAEITVQGGVTNVDTVDNIIVDGSVKIVDAEGNDVTANYAINLITGKLTVTPRPIDITADSNEKVYDDTPLTDGGYTFEAESDGRGLLASLGHDIAEITVQGSVIYVETVDNIIVENSVKILDAEGNDVTANYAINRISGKLEVTQRPIEIVTGSDERVYNGEALKADVESNTALGENVGLLEGHRIEIVEETRTALTNVGSVENVFEVKIFDANNTDVTANYNISYVYGTLKVTKRSVNVTANSDEKIYDGTPLTNDGHMYEEENGDRGLVTGHKIQSIVVEGSITNIGTEQNIVVAGSVVIVDADGNPVTDNYEITLLPGTLEVTKRPINITADSDDKIYDGKPLTKDTATPESESEGRGLLAGHTIKEIVVEGTVTNAVSVDNIIKEGSVVIVDAEGNDVTNNYEITLLPGTLTVHPRPIDITTDSNEKVYDGKELTDDDYTVESEGVDKGLLEGLGHTVHIVINGSITDVGTVDNTIAELKILDAEGNDVSANYAINSIIGKLTVTPRPIDITADSNKKVYDGTELTDGDYTVEGESTGKGLLTSLGHKIRDIVIEGSIINVGTKDNLVILESVVIVDAEGNDVTGNYAINPVKGTLEVTARPIEIVTDSDERVYNGEELTADIESNTALGVNVGLLEGHRIEIIEKTRTRLTNVDSVENVLEVKILDANDVDVTTNYDITYVYGTLTVTKRSITITADTLEKIYDGKELVATFTPEKQNENRGLVLGQKVEAILTPAGITNVDCVEVIIAEDAVKILDAEGNDVTANYEIERVAGKLTVMPRPINITADSDERIYNGKPLTKDTATWEEESEGRGLLEGHKIDSYVIEGTITNVGTVDNIIKEGSVVIVDAEGNDVTANYDINRIAGKLTVTQRPINITADSNSKVYDDTPLTDSGYTVEKESEGRGLLNDPKHTAVVEVEGSITDAGVADNLIVKVTILDENGEDVTANYDVNPIAGTLTVEMRPITVTSGSKDKTYDGTPLTDSSYTYTTLGENVGLLNGHEIIVVIEGSITNVGNNPNKITSIVIMAPENRDVTKNYDITPVEGDLIVKPRPIIITANSDSKVYDDKVLTNSGFTFEDTGTESGIVSGHKVKYIEVVGSIQYVGVKPNTLVKKTEIIVDAEGNDVTANYVVEYIDGTLEITKRPITFTANTTDKVYDGKPLKAEIDSYTEMAKDIGLIDGHRAEVKTYTELTNVGSRDSEITVAIKDATGFDVSENYEIAYEKGKLTVTKRPITITADTLEKIYDGKKLVATFTPEIEGVECGLVESHGITALLTPDGITNVGSVDVVILEDSVKIFDADNTDVTANYELTLLPGKLTVKPRPINITAKDDEKVYDGKPLTNDGYTYESENGDRGLLKGHTVAQAIVEGTVTNATTVDNIIKEGSVVIVDADGNDVTANYAINRIAGKLTVHPRPINITADSNSKVYDDTPLTDSGYTVEEESEGRGLLNDPKHTAVVVVKGSITYVGAEDNVVDQVTILNALGEDVTANYAINPVKGTLEVTARPITVVTATADKVYDGTELKAGYKSYTELGEGVGLLTNHSLEISYWKTIIEVGSVENTSEVRILDANQKDVTDNYDIDYEKGTLTVTKRPLHITSNSDCKVYDGEMLTNPGYVIDQGVDMGVAPNQVEYVRIIGAIIDVGKVSNTVAVVTVSDSKGADVTSNYEISITEGVLEITPRLLTVRTSSASKEYDGTPLIKHSYEVREGSVAPGQELIIMYTGTQTEVGSSKNSFTAYSVLHKGENVTSNYKLTVTEGTLTVTEPPVPVPPPEPNPDDPRPYIEIWTESASKKYDGSALKALEYTVDGDLLDGHTLTVSVIGSQTEIGKSANEFVAVIKDADGNDVTDSYLIGRVVGILWVYEGEITVESTDESKYYDGTPLMGSRYSIEGTLKQGHQLLVSFTASQTFIGSCRNEFEVKIVDADGNDLTDAYKITYICGYLWVYGTPITVESGSDAKYYDGTPLTSDLVELIEGELKPGYSLQVVEITGSQTEVGRSKNYFVVKVVDANGNDALEYEINYEYGILEVFALEDDEEEDENENEGGYDIGLIGGSGGSQQKYVVAHIWSQKSGRVYLREKSYGYYTGSGFAKARTYSELIGGAYSMNYLTGLALEASGYESIQMMIDDNKTFFLPNYLATDEYTHLKQISDTQARGSLNKKYTLYYYAYDAQGDAVLLASVPAEYAEVELAYRNFVHGNYLDIPATTLEFMQGVIAENGFDPQDPAIIKKVAAYVQNAAIYNLDYDRNLDAEDDIAVAFLSEYKTGVCQHYATAATMLFRALGIPARFTVGYVATTAAGQWAEVEAPGHAWVEVYLDGIGWVNVEVTGGGFGNGSGGVDDAKPQLLIKADSATKKYDGTELTKNSYSLLVNELKAGHTLRVTVSGSITEIGSKINRITDVVVLDQYGNDVTNTYLIVTDVGTLTVDPRPINVWAESDEKMYDGTPLTNNEFGYEVFNAGKQTGLLSGHLITATVSGSITNVGSKTNLLSNVKITDAAGNDVTHYYKLNPKNGLLKVTPRLIYVTVNSQTKVYDGTELKNSGYSIDDKYLLEGHRLAISMIKVEGSIIEVGTKKNVVTDYVWKVLDANNDDVTYNYKLECIDGMLEITPRPVTVTADSAEKIYDGTALTKQTATATPFGENVGLLTELGHKLEVVIKGTITNVGSVENLLKGVQILDADGKDVSQNYLITPANGTLTVVKRSLTLTAGSAQKVYDGTPLTNGDITPNPFEGDVGLVAGHVVTGKNTGTQTNAGTSKNKIDRSSVTIKDADGADMSGNYAITYVDGELTVTKRPLILTAASDKKVYDGTALTNDTITANIFKGNTGILPTHKVLGKNTGSQTDVGSSANKVDVASVKIFDASGNDMTANYKIAQTVEGTLTVTKRALVLTAGSDKKVYDGTPLTNGTIIPNKFEGDVGLVAGHVVSGRTDGSVTNVKDSPAVNRVLLATVEIKDANGKDVTRNYELTGKTGKLVVTPRPITITSDNAEKIYDGTPLTKPTVTYDLPDTDVDLIQTLNHTILPEITASRTDAGSEPNTIISVKIIDALKEDMTSNYKITLVNGTLTVFKRSLTLTAGSAEKVYDGNALTNGDIAYNEFEGDVGLVAGQTVTGKNDGTITNAGEKVNQIIRDSLIITDANGKDMLGNYEITYVDGTLVVTKRPIIVAAGSAEKPYDGTPLTSNEILNSGIEGEMGIIEGQTAQGTLVGSQTVVGESANKLEIGTLKIVDANGDDMTGNYEVVETKEGTLTVTPCVIKVTADSAEKLYDGKPLSKPTYKIEGVPQLHVFAHTEIAFEGEITKAGSTPNKITTLKAVIKNAKGEDVSANFTIEIIDGTLTVLPRKIVITANDAEKKYDGTPLTESGFEVDDADLMETDTLKVELVTVQGSITDPGELPNVVAEYKLTVYNANGDDVTDCYEVSLVDGTLLVYRDKLVIQTGSAVKLFDETPLTYDKWDLVGGTLDANHQLIVKVTGSQTAIGVAQNTCEVTVVDENGEEVSVYKIECVFGALEVVGEEPDSGYDIGLPPGGMPEEVVVAEIKSEISGRIYLRERSYGAYLGNGFAPAVRYDGLLDGEFSMNYLTGLALKAEGYESFEMIVKPNGVFMLPNYLSMDSFTHVPQHSDVSAVGSKTTEYMLHYYAFDAQGNAILLASVPAEYAEVELAYRNFVHENYLDIPANTKEFMQNIIEEQGFELDDPRILKKVARYVQTAATYNLEYDRSLDKSSDIAVAFLSQYKEGVCQHYATAATMLFRALGIPARYTVGFTANTVAGEWAEVTTPGHAWVEVYLDGIGWVNVEVTGGGFGNGSGGIGEGEPEPPEPPTGTPIHVTVYPVTQEYDGNECYYFPDDYDPDSVDLPEGYTLELELAGGITDAGYLDLVSLAAYLNFKVTDPDGNDVTDQYHIVLVGEPLTVKQRPLVIQVDSEDKDYDGKELTGNSVTIIQGSLVSGHYIDTDYLRFIGSITYPGTTNVIVDSNTIIIRDADGKDVTDNYYIENILPGTLTVWDV